MDDNDISVVEPLELKEALVNDYDEHSRSLMVGEDTEHYEFIEKYWSQNTDNYMGRAVEIALEFFGDSFLPFDPIYVADGESFSKECSKREEISEVFADFYGEREYFSEEFWNGFEDELGYSIGSNPGDN